MTWGVAESHDPSHRFPPYPSPPHPSPSHFNPWPPRPILVSSTPTHRCSTLFHPSHIECHPDPIPQATPGSDRSQVAARLSALSPATSVAAFPPNGGFIAAKWRTYAKVHSVSFSAGRRVLTALAADLPSQRPTFSFELLYGLLGAGAGLANQVAPLLLLHLGAPPSAHCDEGGGELLRTLRVSLYSS